MGGLLTVIVIAAVAALFVVVPMLRGDDSSDSAVDIPSAATSTASAPASAPTSTPVPAPSALVPGCPTLSDGAVSSGADAGGTRGGVAVIKAFQYQYFVARNAAAAQALQAPTARRATVADLQKALTAIPAGTTHCVAVTDRGAGRFAVTVNEMIPGAPPKLFYQLVQTADVGNTTLIVSVAKDLTEGK